MKRRSFPLWLLRDVPALLGVLASFWSLVICAMINDCKAMRADYTGKIIRDQIGNYSVDVDVAEVGHLLPGGGEAQPPAGAGHPRHVTASACPNTTLSKGRRSPEPPPRPPVGGEPRAHGLE